MRYILITFLLLLPALSPAQDVAPAPGPEEAFELALGLDDMEGILLGLEQFGPNHRFSESDGWTPLMMANSLEVQILLMDRGADPTLTDDLGYNCAHHVIFADWAPELLPRMFAAGVDVNAQSKGGETLFDFTTHWFDGRDAVTGKELLRLLVAHGADVDRRLKNGLTHLMKAAAEDKPHLARVLLDLGADPCLRSAHGATALEIALKRVADRAFAVLLDSACRN